MAHVAIDRLTDAVLKSTREFLAGELVGPGKTYTGVYISSPDFDHDQEGSGTKRTTPYVTLVFVQEETVPWEIGDRRVERRIEFDLWVVCESFSEALRRPSRIQQVMLTSEDQGVPGAIPLRDFDRQGAPIVDHVEIETGVIAPFLDIDSKEKWRNLKYVGVVRCRVSREKRKDAELIA